MTETKKAPATARATTEHSHDHAHAHDHAHGHDHGHDHGHHHHDHDHDHDHGHDHDHPHTHGEKEFEFDEAPAFDVQYKGDCAYEVKVSIAGANGRKRANELFEELKDDALVPGFRKGKAPRALLERRYAKHVREDVTNTLISAAFRKLVKDQDLRPIAFPDIDDPEALKAHGIDDALDVTLKFEVAPRCELGKYRGLAVERPVLKIEDREIDEAIEGLRMRYATYGPVDDKAADGDRITIDFEGSIDGAPVTGGKAEGYPYVLGSGRFYKEFDEAIAGHKAGETVTAEVPFPADHTSKDLAGKTVRFAITLGEISRRESPAVDDEFAKKAGFEDVADMRAKVAAELREGANEQSDRIVEYRLMRQVIGASTFELPKTLLANAAIDYFQQELRRLAALRTPPAEIDARLEDIRRDAEENALRDIKIFSAINEIAEAEGIEVTEADMEREAEAIGKRTGMDMAVVQRFLAESDRRSEYESRIHRQKAVAVLKEHATIADKEVEREDLNKAAEQAGSEE